MDLRSTPKPFKKGLFLVPTTFEKKRFFKSEFTLPLVYPMKRNLSLTVDYDSDAQTGSKSKNTIKRFSLCPIFRHLPKTDSAVCLKLR